MASTYPTSNPTSHPAGYPQPSKQQNSNWIESLCLGLTETKQSHKGIKLRYLVNFFKATTAMFIISLMNHYRNYSLGSCLYLALHGIYGLIWLLKDFSFPDKNFDKRVGIFGAIMNFFALSAYWMIPFLQISGHGIDKPSSERVMGCVMLFAMGIATLISSDAQKNFTLENRPGLITSGMFKYTRNPNYLGQMMVHASFAFATGSVISWSIVATLWTVFFLPRMIAKDAALRKMDGAKEYFRQSSMLLPKFFFKSTFLHYMSWLVIFGSIWSLGGAISFTHAIKKFHPLKWLSRKF